MNRLIRKEELNHGKEHGKKISINNPDPYKADILI